MAQAVPGRRVVASPAMPEPSFRGDPYEVLGVPGDVTDAQLKRRWRELARTHHPDNAAGDPAEQARLTARMARINAAYDVLRDPVRRARHDSSPHGARARQAASPADDAAYGGHPVPDGPPPPPPTRPVTGRFDTSATWQPRDVRTVAGRSPLGGQGPRRRERAPGRDLRASTPTGPVRTRRTQPAPPLPTLEESEATVLEFGRFHGWTLGAIAAREPTYIDWIARTITRDRDLVVRARMIAAELDRRGVVRRARPTGPGPGDTGPDGPEARDDV